jgi:hypothetical protein
MAEDFDAAVRGAPSPYRVSWRTRLVAGIAAGILSTILMMGLMMTYSSMVGEGASMPLKALGALVYGVEALVAGPTAMLTGAGIQLGFSMVLGILFAVAMSVRPSVILALLAGIVVGVAIWLTMELWVLPLWDPTMGARVALMPWVYFVAHVLFGVGLGTASIFLRTLNAARHQRPLKGPAQAHAVI